MLGWVWSRRPSGLPAFTGLPGTCVTATCKHLSLGGGFSPPPLGFLPHFLICCFTP